MSKTIIRISQVLLLVTTLLFVSGFSQTKEKVVSDFKLKNVDGRFVSLKDYPDAKGFIIVFTCNHCPFARLYPPRLNELNAKYKALGVPLIAISSTDTVVYEGDSYALMVAKAHDEQFNFPYLYDDMQLAARNYGAQKTPHAYVIWKKNGRFVVKYNGAIDDNGMEPEKVKSKYVSKAVDDLLAGRSVATPETKSIGCQINMRK